MGKFLFIVGEVNVRMFLYGICISPLLNLGHAKRESFQNKPGSHDTWGNTFFIGQRPLFCWGHLKSQAFEAQSQSAYQATVVWAMREKTGVLMVLVAFPYYRSPRGVTPWFAALLRKMLL